ncbi:hypothetical protein IWQ57_004401, partial [Coemansia nantahalensis]
ACATLSTRPSRSSTPRPSSTCTSSLPTRTPSASTTGCLPLRPTRCRGATRSMGHS